jgi:hypothetical protein
MTPAAPIPTVEVFRKILLAVLIFGLIGTEVELFLLEHTDGYWQLAPVVILGIGLMAIGWAAVSQGRASLLALRAMAIAFVLSGAAGALLHYNGNVEFELEMMPGLGGLELFGRAMMGATPALAPGVMIQLGLLGWLYTFRHPGLRAAGPSPTTDSES